MSRVPLMSLVMMILLVAACGGCASTARADITADVTIEPTGDDTAARILHCASVLDDGRVLVTGGLGLTLIPPSLFSRDEAAVYDPDTGQFTDLFEPGNDGVATTLALNIERSSHTQTTLADGRVLIAGGRTGADGTNPGSRIASVELFDPFTGLFTLSDAMAHTRSDHSATLLTDGRVLIAGGDAAGTWQVFDPADDSWSAAFPLEHTRTSHAAVLLPGAGGARRYGSSGGHVLLIGGGGSGPATMEVIDVGAQDSTLLTSTLPGGLDDLAAVTVPDGGTLVIGGQSVATGDTTSACHWVDPVADTITPAPAVPDRPGGISDHVALRVGRLVVILGGEQQQANEDTELSYIAVFDTHVNEWVYSGDMAAPHDDAAAVLLDDDRVLVIGGGVPFLGQELPTADCELVTVSCITDGDATRDCRVDLQDLLAVIGGWGCSSGSDPCPCSGDATGDCTVNLDDLLAVIGNWGG